MKSAISKVFGAGVLGVTLLSCAPQSPKLVEPPVIVPEKVTNSDTRVSFNPKVDILFVVDDSGSMATHQKNLADNITLYTDNFKNEKFLDYHIGVVTSSVYGSDPWGGGGATASDGDLVYGMFVERGMANATRILKTILQVGTSGSGSESFFDPVKLALTPPKVATVNAGFYRPDAHLAVIFITDAEDQSAGIPSERDFYRFLVRDLKGGDPEKVSAYGVIIPINDSKCNRGGEDKPVKLERFLNMANGKILGLCDPQFGVRLADLGQDLLRKVTQIVPLTRPPAQGTITVRYGTQIIPNDAQKGWLYDAERNALILGPEIEWTDQPDGTTIQVDFIAAQY